MKLPWPDRTLNPNVKTHWAIKAKQIKIHRDMAFVSTKCTTNIEKKGTTLEFTFTPPDKRKRDVDNMLAMCKAYLDGICDALSINDEQFTKIVVIKKPPKKGGYVEIIIK